jgi:GPH family glycoside/pentoside/hexuronide:cation symporter
MSPGGAPSAGALGWRTLTAYALPSAGVSAIATLFVVMYLKFATDRLGVSALAMGWIFLAAKIWNALSDPLIGSLSDRTRSRWGRRRSWLAACALPFGLLSWAIWAPPAGLGGGALTGWVAASVFGFYTAMTAFEVPHAAWGVELTHDPQSRNRLFGLKYFVRALGLAFAFGVGVGVVGDAQTGRAGASALSLAMGLVTALSILAVLPLLPRERDDYQGRGGVSIRRALGDVWGNREARLLIFVFFIEAIGLGGLTVLVPYVTEYVMHRPDLTQAMLGVYVGASFLAIPVWVALARRFEKKSLWLYSMVQGGIGFGLLLFLGENGWPLMTVSSLLAGSAQACGNSIGQSLKADVIDLDELRTGERKEGAYFAAWSFVLKLGNALLASSAGFALYLAGYVPNAEQSPLVKTTLLLLMGGMPLAGYAVGALVFARFPFTSAEHARVRAALDARVSPRVANGI